MFQYLMVGRKAGIALLLAFVCLFASWQVAEAAVSEPMVEIKASVDKILQIVRESKASSDSELQQAKRQQVMDVVYGRFDFRAMSQLALARNWKTITPEEQDRFVALFAQVLESTYFDRINSYSGEQVLFKEQRMRGDKAIVSSVVVNKDTTETPVDYKLRQLDGKWVVYDVIIEGVSLVRNYRTQFASIIEKEKYAGLVKRLEEKIANKEADK